MSWRYWDMEECIFQIDRGEVVVLVDHGAYRLGGLHLEAGLLHILVEGPEVENRPQVACLLDDGEEFASETRIRSWLDCFLLSRAAISSSIACSSSDDIEDRCCRRLVVGGDVWNGI